MIYVTISNTVSSHVLTKSILRSIYSLNTKVSATLFSTLALFLEVSVSNLFPRPTALNFFFLFPSFHRQIDEALTVYILTYFAFSFSQC